jgi:hypothetical protein
MDRLERERKLYREDAKFCLDCKVKATFCRIMRGGQHSFFFSDFVGYTAEELRNHIAANFQEGMNFENYGKWHIDHIIPRSAFDYISPACSEFAVCNSLENIAPMWAKDNLKKWKNYEGSC